MTQILFLRHIHAYKTILFGKVNGVLTWLVNSTNHSAGFAILSHNFEGEVYVSKADSKGHMLEELGE